MSEKGDFRKFLKSIGAVPTEPGTRHERWLIGKQIFEVPGDLRGRRQFQNYRLTALRVAREEGLLPEKKAEPAPIRAGPRRARRRIRTSASHDVSEATPEEIAAWRAIEEARWKQAKGGGEMSEEAEGGAAPRAKKIALAERIPLVERVLREAGRPLTIQQIMEPLGWSHEHDGTNTFRALRTNPQRFRPTRGTKRNERWELVPTPKEGETSDSAGVKAEAGTPTGVPIPLADAAALISVAEAKLTRIEQVLGEFQGDMDPHRAFWALGRIKEIIESAPPNPAT